MSRVFPTARAKIANDTLAWKVYYWPRRALHALGLHSYGPSITVDIDQMRVDPIVMRCIVCGIKA